MMDLVAYSTFFLLQYNFLYNYKYTGEDSELGTEFGIQDALQCPIIVQNEYIQL